MANKKPIVFDGGGMHEQLQPGDVLVDGDGNPIVGSGLPPGGIDGQVLGMASGAPAWVDPGASLDLQQQTLLNLAYGDNGSSAPSAGNPKTLSFAKPWNNQFKNHPVNVLKLVPGATNVVTTECGFNVGDAAAFGANPLVVFDGTARLKTAFSSAFADLGVLGGGEHSARAVINTTDLAVKKMGVA